MTKGKPKSAAIYVRISSDPEGLRLGVTRQREDCETLAERLGWTVAEVYEENDTSASKGKRRPVFEQMLADCEAGSRDGILVYSTDRLTRRLAELAGFLDWREKHNIQFATTEGDDTTSANGLFMIQVKGAMAQQEARRISERVTRSHLQLAQRGKVGGGGSRPYGYDQDRLTVRLDEAANIKEIARRVLAGESLKSIARTYGMENNVLKRMITGPRIVGLRGYHRDVMRDGQGEPVVAEWPAILDMDTWLNVRAVLLDPARNPSTGRIDRKYLFSGFLRCRCGGKMYGLTKDGDAYYRCGTGQGGCGQTMRKAEPIDQHLTDVLLLSLEMEALVIREPVVSLVEDELAEAERSLAALVEEWSAGRMSDQVFFAAQSKREERVLELKRERAAERRNARSPIGPNVRQEWQNATLSRRRAIIARSIQAVKVQPKPRSAPRTFDPAYYEVVWRD